MDGRRPIAALAMVVVASAGAGLLAAAYATAPVPPPQPAAAAAPASSSPSPTPTPSATPPVLPRSAPTRVDIASINLHAPIAALGVDNDGSVQVPPLERPELAGWYQDGPSPGELGPAVLLGHVDSYQVGPAVFFYLGALKPGAPVEVTRADHSVVTFKVDGVVAVQKNNFPTAEVYGPLPYAGLRLITCGGQFDPKQRSYLGNTVVYASFVSWRPGNAGDDNRPLRTYYPPLPPSPHRG
jgi:hypothetical protein